MLINCCICYEEYDSKSRAGKPGKITHCDDCAEEATEKYTGNMIYDHKTACTIQINASKALTEYITNATKLRNKGSNLGSNLKVSGPTKTENACIVTADAALNAKGKN